MSHTTSLLNEVPRDVLFGFPTRRISNVRMVVCLIVKSIVHDKALSLRLEGQAMNSNLRAMRWKRTPHFFALKAIVKPPIVNNK